MIKLIIRAGSCDSERSLSYATIGLDCRLFLLMHLAFLLHSPVFTLFVLMNHSAFNHWIQIFRFTSGSLPRCVFCPVSLLSPLTVHGRWLGYVSLSGCLFCGIFFRTFADIPRLSVSLFPGHEFSVSSVVSTNCFILGTAFSFVSSVLFTFTLGFSHFSNLSLHLPACDQG